MPATADAAVITWRKWLDKFGDELPVLPRTAADLPPALPREQVFDRYAYVCGSALCVNAVGLGWTDVYCND